MDLECPYCGKGIDICHDDGFGYQEDVSHEMECEHCGKSFVFNTSISYHYHPYKADCLNDGKHDFQLTTTYPREWTQMECSMCGERRELTDEEKKANDIGSKELYFESLNRL